MKISITFSINTDGGVPVQSMTLEGEAPDSIVQMSQEEAEHMLAAWADELLDDEERAYEHVDG